jgi:hypothetical protein
VNTPAHLLIGTAAFGRPARRGTTLAAFLGSLAPDLSLYLMAAVSIWILGVPAETVFREYYYSDTWQAVFAVDNSFILWGAGLILALRVGRAPAIAFTAAGLLHLALDFPLHTHDARMHFWPLTDWVFESPVSYWDRRAHAGIVGPIAWVLAAGAATAIVLREKRRAVQATALLLLAFETVSDGVWRFVF